MQSSTFIAEQSQQPAEIFLSLAGQTCRVHTNSDALSDLLAASSPAFESASCCELSVIANRRDLRPLETPRFRGMHHLAIATFGPANVFVFDLHRRRIAARIAAPLVEDEVFWRQTFLPIAAGFLGPSIGILPVHSACLSRGQNGLLIAGISGAGKSTLSLALALRGLEFIADEWSYCSIRKNVLVTHGADVPLKLLPEAASHFPSLRAHPTSVAMNGELAFEVDPTKFFGVQRRSWCYPRLCVFYERTNGAAEFERLDRKSLRGYLLNSVERLPPQLAQMQANRRQLIERISDLPCWRFSSSSLPDTAAEELEAFFDEQLKSGEIV